MCAEAKFPEYGRVAFYLFGMINTIVLLAVGSCGPMLALGIIDYDGGKVARHKFSSGATLQTMGLEEVRTKWVLRCCKFHIFIAAEKLVFKL